ncbi:pyridoxamine 5'-phosphate oxidase-domain-containing protein [Scheffersomyces amazonensis]|uniref:pyridoxamine 5'-phosphate oxidase-domain-containing protein n=1 Tax=Scheffersomyces amazonensis TaxID=1078765 RepID=UPI00315CA16F
MILIINLLYILIACVCAGATPIRFDEEQTIISNRIPSEIEAASIARTLVFRESLTNINTIKKIISNGIHKSIPVSSVEYYVDVDEDGDPYLLLVDIGSTNQNIIKGSEFSLTIRVGDHPTNDDVNEEYPGGIENSPAGSPRVQLTGKLVNKTYKNPLDIDLIKLETAFLRRHPDARYWLPNSIVSPHKSHWVKFKVEDIYLIGGFGDRAYIGSIDPEIYHSVGTIPDADSSL